jgi:uncharacterized membrane protein YhiD involved in acid resistance
MAVGGGMFHIAAMVTLMALFVQLAFTQLDIWIDDWRERHTFRIVSKIDHETIAEIEKIFHECRLHILRRKLMKKNNLYYSEWFATGGRVNQDTAQKRLMACEAVFEVTY